MFIELTHADGQKFLANVNHIQRIDEKPNGSYVTGLNNNGGFAIKESYKEINALWAKYKLKLT